MKPCVMHPYVFTPYEMRSMVEPNAKVHTHNYHAHLQSTQRKAHVCAACASASVGHNPYILAGGGRTSQTEVPEAPPPNAWVTHNAFSEHFAHGRDLGRVEAERLVERRRALPSRKAGMRCGRRYGPEMRARGCGCRALGGTDSRLQGPGARAERT